MALSFAHIAHRITTRDFQASSILARDFCDNDPNCLPPQSPWYTYGRWILLAIIIALAILIFILFAFISVRRRKKMGDNPLPLTGWAQRPNKNQWEQGYVHQNGQSGQERSGVVQNGQSDSGNGDESWPGAGTQVPPPAYTQNQGTGVARD